MAKRANQKMKLLVLAQILEQESDENHPLSVQQIITALARQDIPAERKSVYDDIESLRQFGLDIVTVRGKGNAYFLGQRDFELAELKLLVDAVGSAKFITAEKSAALIKKICTLTSRHEGGLMQRQVHVAGRAKTVNKRTYYSVDTLHTAIAQNRQVTFTYTHWVVDAAAPHLYESRARRGGRRYQISPFALLWDDEYYYLVAYDESADKMKHYRVDRMEGIAMADAPRTGHKAYEALDMNGYSRRMFNMYGGVEEQVRLRFANHLISVVVDRFGSSIIIHRDGDEHFTITVRAVVSPQFFSWLFGFGPEAQILEPAPVAAQMQQIAAGVCAMYAENGAENDAESGKS